ncbi:MAG: hypothetical protein ACR2P2_22895 [Nakamurella sp.]
MPALEVAGDVAVAELGVSAACGLRTTVVSVDTVEVVVAGVPAVAAWPAITAVMVAAVMPAAAVAPIEMDRARRTIRRRPSRGS